ncbi:TlpA disulfide reductase family protein [Paludisphaera mucosa]|uniref:TlpA disulfide reductase family protein n=1 Tax=Paludisphaera mucosa TaxID=3030827 RepID=A0ABT6FF61_9BACT|nr:TlpA disulfide reductase family protein [Paludisphaera mucosa]MDG3006213.1 TlpA disulfide reductase family protein [Paludisphaera mucosa]
MIRTTALLTACLVAALAAQAPARAEDPETEAVSLRQLTWADFQKHLASNKDAKWIMVDAWATNCGPCKENFPHVVEMHRKYGPKGLAVISLSLDDIEDVKAVADAEKFLRDNKATFTNVLLKEESGVGFEKLNVGAIPAVFLFGPDGQEVMRFTWDDPNNQFTYDEVEKEVIKRLGASN